MWKRGDTIQGRTLYKGGHYLRKYGMYIVSVTMLKSSCQIFRFDESKLGIWCSSRVLLAAKHFFTKRSEILGKNAVDHNNDAAIKDHQ